MSGRWRGAAMVVVALLGDGAARAETPRAAKLDVPRDLGALPRADVTWAATTGILYAAGALVIESHEDTARLRALEADGRERWRVDLPRDADLTAVTATASTGDVVLGLDTGLVALDARTGHARWRRPTGRVDALRTAGADLFVVFVVPPRDPKDEGGSWPREVARVDGRTGAERWRVPCVDTLCGFEDVSDERVVVHGYDALVRLDGHTGKTLGSIKPPGRVVLVDGDVALVVAALEGPIKAPRLTAIAIADGRPSWSVTLDGGDPIGLDARPSGTSLVVFARNEIAVLDRASGVLRARGLLPEGFASERPSVLPDGRVVAVARSSDDQGGAARVLAIVTPAAASPVSLWTLPVDVELAPDGGHLRLLAARGWGTVRLDAPLPPPRATLSLADDVAARLDRLIAAGAVRDDRPDARATFDREGTLPFLRRLGRDAYKAAVLARLVAGGAVAVPELVDLVAPLAAWPYGQPPPVDAPTRAALARALEAAVAELPRAPAPRRLLLARAARKLLAATPGVLPEAPVRALGAALASLLRETWPALPAPVRAAIALDPFADHADVPWRGPFVAATTLLDEARAFDGLLWRAPYAAVDRPLREAVAAVGPTRPCPYPMSDAYHLTPLHPPDLSCAPEAPPAAALRTADWAVWTSPGVGSMDDAWGMAREGGRWSAARFLGRDATARGVLAKKIATGAERLALGAALAKAARDTDGDGLTDALEATLGLDPARADTDGDGVPDGRDPSPLCAPPKRPLTHDEEIAADLAWVSLGLRTDASPALFALPDPPSGQAPEACVEIPTLGGPVIVGSEAVVNAIKERAPALTIYSGSLRTLEPAERARARPFRAILRGAEIAGGAWGQYTGRLNAGGHRAILARVGGRWRVVTVLMRFIS